jgi:hypothetical protein
MVVEAANTLFCTMITQRYSAYKVKSAPTTTSKEIEFVAVIYRKSVTKR